MLNLTALDVKCSEYVAPAENGSLYELPRTTHRRGVDPIVAGTTLRKSELNDLYGKYMVPDAMPARRLIYDAIKVSANGRCPFCGGIGYVRNLDHYLPKSRFPEFSVFPGNLIPSCMDCNMGEKGVSIAADAGGQVLHPYYDPDHFFQEQWLVGSLSEGEPVFCTYHVAAPDHWSPTDKKRVETHFEDFGLKHRFELEASGEVSSVVNLRRASLRDMNAEEFRGYLLTGAADNHLAINHWRRVLYKAMSESEWFCEYAF